jgi:hypothetical protein
VGLDIKTAADYRLSNMRVGMADPALKSHGDETTEAKARERAVDQARADKRSGVPYEIVRADMRAEIARLCKKIDP